MALVSPAPGSVEADGRILLLIAGFTTSRRGLEGRTKLAKLDFLLRYPAYLERALRARGVSVPEGIVETPVDIETRMVRYRYGPWDPAYFSILGRLIGTGLIEARAGRRGADLWATAGGKDAAHSLGAELVWAGTRDRVRLLRRHFDLSGSTLMRFVYDHFPEVGKAEWGDVL